MASGLRPKDACRVYPVASDVVQPQPARMSTDDRLVREFGQALRALRQQRGFSQETLAAEAGMNRTYISDLERGQYSPSLTAIAALAAALGVKPHELVRAAESNRDGPP